MGRTSYGPNARPPAKPKPPKPIDLTKPKIADEPEPVEENNTEESTPSEEA